jgi:uncharacterized protein (TIGR02466 family)
MSIVNLFSTPIYEYTGDIEEIFLVQHEIKTILPAVLASDIFENPVGWKDGVRTNIKFRHNTIVDFQMKNLAAYIETHIRKYISLVGAWEPMPNQLGHSWINLVDKGSRQDWHQHQDATISGTYYFQTSENDGDITFRTPNQFVELELFPLGSNINKFFSVQPKVGKLVLFPGWLAHCVEENTQDSTRISISFNYLRNNFPAKTS